MKIANVGTFDVENFGDLLFPLVVRKRMRSFFPASDFTFVSPTSGPPPWDDCVSTIAFDEFVSGPSPDAVLVGGGNIIRSNSTNLAAYDSALTPLLAYASLWAGISARFIHNSVPICWNAVGVPTALSGSLHPALSSWLKRVDYISVRDRDSSKFLLQAEGSLDVAVVPDTAWDVCDLWPRDDLANAYVDAFQSRGRAPAERTLSIHLNDRYVGGFDHRQIAAGLDALCASLKCTPVLMALGPCHGDDELARTVASYMSSNPLVLDKPGSLQEIVAILARSVAYLGSSMHGFIAASSFCVPAAMIASPAMLKFPGLVDAIDRRSCLFHDWSGAIKAAPHLVEAFDTGAAAALQSGITRQLDNHWQRIADKFSERKGAAAFENDTETAEPLRSFRATVLAAAPVGILADRAARMLPSGQEEIRSLVNEQRAAETELRNKLRAAEAENMRLKQRDRENSQKLRTLHQKLGETRRAREQIFNSTTWRATAPLRAVGDKLPGSLRSAIRSGARVSYWLAEPHLLPRRFGQLRSRLQAGLGRKGWFRRNSIIAPRESVAAANVQADVSQRDIAIVVPIYNAAEELKACVTSVLRHTDPCARLILVDDASPDAEIKTLLRKLESIPNVSVVENATNCGFTRTVNRGIAFAGSRDVVLLNSDTIVTPNWLSKLQRAAYSGPRVATATPFSDNAGAFSVPAVGQKNPIPTPPGLDGYARLVTQHSSRLYPQIPTWNAYCMFIKRACIEEIGVLDSDAFPRGYGEENDFCMRAIRAGWTHVIDDSTLIHHVRSASFGESKNELMSAGRSIVDKRYPEYAEAIRVFTRDEEIEQARKNAAAAYAAAKQDTQPKPRLLFVVSTRTGGTPQTNQDLMNALSDRYDCYLLRCDSRVIEFSRSDRSGTEPVRRHALKAPIKAFPHTSEEYDQVVHDLIQEFNIELVHIRHIAWHSLNLTKVAKRTGLPVVFSFHDFYTICPTVKLLDENLVYCGGKCTETLGECSHELWRDPDFPPLKHNAIAGWQTMFSAMLADSDAFVTTSDEARQQIETIYPAVRDRPFRVIPHGRDLGMQRLGGLRREPGEKLRILVPGNIDAAKGALILEALARLDRGRNFEFHLLGFTNIRSAPGLIIHPPYKREEFGRLVERIEPHIGAIFSIWPETFCHTLTEMWAAGLPVAGLDLGAVGERLRKSGGGWTHPLASPDRIHDWLLSIARDVKGIEVATDKVSSWQRGPGSEITTGWMSQQYESLYKRVLERRNALLSSADPALTIRSNRDELALVPSYWDSGAIAGTGWVRLLNPFRRTVGVQSTVMPPGVLPVPGFAGTAMLQRDANRFALAELQEWLAAWKSAGGKLIYDVDDNLLDADSLRSRVSVDPHAIVHKVRWLAANADLVTVSTPVLENKFRPISKRVAVIANFLEPDLWRLEDREKPQLRLRDTSPNRLGYIGTRTHDADLAIVEKAVRGLKNDFGQNIDIEVIGGFTGGTTGFGTLMPLPSQNEYP